MKEDGTSKVESSAAPQSNEAPQTVKTHRYIHSDVFEKLVAGPDDLAGLVAYGYYQQRKRQWIEACKSKHGEVPSEERLKDFAFGYQDDQIKALKQDAEGTLFRFAESVIETKTKEMQESAFNARTVQEVASLRAAISKISGYKHHIVGHVVGFIVLVFLTFIFSIAITKEPHLSQLVSWVFSRSESPPH